MIIATFNVNSVRSRYLNLIEFLNNKNPDVVLLQEIKCQKEQFPFMELEDLGYNIKVKGQKSYNGVAVLSKYSIDDYSDALPTFIEDENARYIEAFINGYRIVNIYSPNGNPIDSPKFDYKIKWLEKFTEHIKNLLKLDEPLIIGGDYNVAHTDREIYDPKQYKDNAIAHPKAREIFNSILNLGLTDAYRAINPDKEDAYTWFGYRGAGFLKHHGLLLDYFLLSPNAADNLINAEIDLETRAKDKPSDHAPLIIEMKG